MTDPETHLPGQYPTSPPEMILDDHGAVSANSQVSKTGIGGRIALGAMAVGLVAAGGFAARAALAPPSGPANSDEAITEFFTALDEDDLIGLVELVHPAERESIGEPMLDMLAHMQRLEIIASEGTDPEGVTFTDTQVDGLTYTVEETGQRLHYVTTTGGTVTTPNDTSVPGGALFDRFDLELPDVDPGTTTVDLGDDPVRIAVVEDDGSWYVSLWYSAAEDIRRNEGRPFSELGSGPAPVGAPDPEGVMEQMVGAIGDLDPNGVLTMLDPREAAVLYDYSSLYLNDMDDAMEEVRVAAEAEGISWTVDEVDFDAKEINGRQVVSLATLALTVEYEVDGQRETATARLEGGCTIVTVESETINSCEQTTDAQAEEAAQLTEQALEILDFSEATLDTFEKLGNVETGLTVVERDGRWYLSLFPTALETVNDHLAVLEPEDLVAVGTDIEEIIEDGDRIIEEMFDLVLGTDFDSLQGGEGGAVALGELLDDLGGAMDPFGGDGGAVFEEVSPPIGEGDSDDFEDYVEPELGPLVDVLIDPEDWIGINYGFSYLSWEAYELETPPYLAGAYSVGGGSVEVVQFESPVDWTQLDTAEWTFEVQGDVTVATRTETGTSFSFVGDYVVWHDSEDSASIAMAISQIALLPR